MSNRNNEEARAVLGNVRKLVLKAEKEEAEKGDPWVIYALAASVAAAELKKPGIEIETVGALTVIAAQCYELAGASRMAVRYAEQGMKMALSPTDLGILRQIQNKAMVAV
jgi:hypothetical protein